MAKYIEIDFAENTTKKAMTIRKSKELSAVLGKPEDVSLGACPLCHSNESWALTSRAGYSERRDRIELPSVSPLTRGLAHLTYRIPRPSAGV